MSPRQPNQRIQKEIERAIRALQNCGLEVGGVEYLGDGRFNVLTRESAKADAYADWQRRRERA